MFTSWIRRMRYSGASFRQGRVTAMLKTGSAVPRTTDEMLEEFAYLGEDTAYEVVVKNTILVSEWTRRTFSPFPTEHSAFFIEGAEED